MTSRYKLFEPIVITSSHKSGDDWMGLKGRVNEKMIEMIAPDFHERHVFTCGPQGFMEAVKQNLVEQAFNMSNFHMESFGGIRTDSKTKLTPPAHRGSTMSISIPLPALQPKEELSPVKALNIEFARSGKKTTTDGKLPLLEVAEEEDVDLDYSCRSGNCGDCKARLLKGEVDMEIDDGLSADEKAEGYILTCVSTPVSDCVLDA